MGSKSSVVWMSMAGVLWLGCSGGHAGSNGVCTEGEKSQAGSIGDPCPQTNTQCAAMGRTASSTCTADGVWAECTCDAVGMTCGNNVKEGTEECDGADLAGATCADLVPGGSGTLSCNPTSCSYDTSLCSTGVGGSNAVGGQGG